MKRALELFALMRFSYLVKVNKLFDLGKSEEARKPKTAPICTQIIPV